MMKIIKIMLILLFCILTGSEAQSLHELQQDFVDLRFGMFIHFNIPTFMNEDWADPEAPPALFNPTRPDCNQWAQTAKAANMSYGCLTTKHHSGFCIWDTKTTAYSVMNSPYRKDVVKEYVDAFRKQGLKVMLYYSILDTHHKLRPGWISPQHVEMVKAQLTELLTNYGEITALIIDGWDAPWSRISYDDIPFGEVYRLVKHLQPQCLMMDLNAAKYPPEILFYTDIKSYEQGAGQHLSKEANRLPALSCLPINSSWFWKEDFPATPVRDPRKIVNENIIPLNNAWCNFILNVAPNREGLIDDNAVAALKEIGKLWQPAGSRSAGLPECDRPVISPNLAKHVRSSSSWSQDMHIADFANDDDYTTSWHSNPAIKEPWIMFDLGTEQPFSMITVAEGGDESRVRKYRIEYMEHNVWKTLLTGEDDNKIKVRRFEPVWGNKVKITFERFVAPPIIEEIGIYSEKKSGGRLL
jgi:alpha-L-fucosidase